MTMIRCVDCNMLWSRYTSESLQFGKIDVNKWSDLAVENRINVSTSSRQLPTFILFQNGKEVMRSPQITDAGKVIKTVLDRVRESLLCCLKCMVVANLCLMTYSYLLCGWNTRRRDLLLRLSSRS